MSSPSLPPLLLLLLALVLSRAHGQQSSCADPTLLLPSSVDANCGGEFGGRKGGGGRERDEIAEDKLEKGGQK